MKRIILLACVMLFGATLLANDTLIFRISNPWRPEKDANGSYIRKVIPTADSGFLALDYNGEKLMTKGFYTDTDFNVRIYCHYFYNAEKGFVKEIKCFDSYGNIKMHAELDKHADTIWRQTFKNDEVVSSKVFPENEAARTIFFSMQKPAIYPGGTTAWKKFVASNLKYPKEASTKKIQGTVLLEFTISKEGKVVKPKVIQSADPLLDAEAVRFIISSPNWIPAEANGVKINSTQRRSVVFQL